MFAQRLAREGGYNECVCLLCWMRFVEGTVLGFVHGSEREPPKGNLLQKPKRK